MRGGGGGDGSQSFLCFFRAENEEGLAARNPTSQRQRAMTFAPAHPPPGLVIPLRPAVVADLGVQFQIATISGRHFSIVFFFFFFLLVGTRCETFPLSQVRGEEAKKVVPSSSSRDFRSRLYQFPDKARAGIGRCLSCTANCEKEPKKGVQIPKDFFSLLGSMLSPNSSLEPIGGSIFFQTQNVNDWWGATVLKRLGRP